MRLSLGSWRDVLTFAAGVALVLFAMWVMVRVGFWSNPAPVSAAPCPSVASGLPLARRSFLLLPGYPEPLQFCYYVSA